jgi:hypothetical protein
MNSWNKWLNGEFLTTLLAVFASVLSPCPANAQTSVVSLSLIDASSNTVITGYDSISDNAILNLDELPSELNIRANTSPETIGSVRFAINGNANYSLESVAPYALAGDSNGNYNNWMLTPGNYTLTATPYSEASGGGNVGTPLTINFSLVEGTLPVVSITSPNNGSQFGPAPASFLLEVTASDPNGTITQVEFFQDGATLGIDTTAPFEMMVDELTAGSYTFRAQATDNEFNTVTSDPISVTVTQNLPGNTYLEQDGLIIMEMENTPTELGLWVFENDLAGYTGSGYFRFMGNTPINGPPNSPLEYKFKVTTPGYYYLHLHMAKTRYDDREDLANDVYVRLEGNFGPGPNPGNSHGDDAQLQDLQQDTKLFGGGIDQFRWSSGNVLDLGGHNNKRIAIYQLNACEEYTLTVSGRSQLCRVDRIMFRHESITKNSAENLNNPESSLLGQIDPCDEPLGFSGMIAR